MSFLSRYVGRSTLALLAVALFALMGIVGMSFWLSQRSAQYFDQVIDNRDVRVAAVALGNALQSAESAQRGFLVTGNEIYLAPYEPARVTAKRNLDALKRLLASDPQLSVPLDRLGTLLAEKFEEMDQTVALKRARKDAEALAIVQSNRGKTLMDEAKVYVSGIISKADEQLTAGVGEQRENANWLRLMSGIAALFIVVVVGGAAYGLVLYARQLKAARDEAAELNAGLERRVEERTADLVQAREKAETLLTEVNHRVANSLTMVSSLIGLQAKALKNDVANKALGEAQQRIFAISLVHRRLYVARDVNKVELVEYLSSLLDNLRASLRSESGAITIEYELQPIEVSTDQAVNLGVIATEWVTNAFKYAYPDGPGVVRVRTRELPGPAIELSVEDDGIGKQEGAPARGTGLGTRVVNAMASSLGGDVRYEARNPGTVAKLVFPLASANLRNAG